MKTDTIVIPVAIAASIFGIYFGAILLLEGLRRAYLAPTVGQPASLPFSFLSTEITSSIALVIFACVLIIGFAAGMMFSQKSDSTSNMGVSK